ncbi:MAG: hypothetical protein Q9216_006835 [Gyalolechia sp. 2 TL-2023]
MDIVPEEPETRADALKTRPKNGLSRLAARDPDESVPTSAAFVSAIATSDSTTAHYHPAEAPLRKRTADPETTRKVEAIILQIIQSLQRREDSVSIVFKTRQASETSPFRSNGRSSNGHYKLSFPGNTPQEAWRFSTAGLTETVCRRTSSMLTCSPAVVLRILELIHEALVEDVVVSKRNIYYKDPELFKSQTIVDRYVDILAYTFGIQRTALNVAKGYPDVSTRAFLRLLSISSYPPPPIYALVDFDPDGIAIMYTYKHGSFTLSHENANLRTPTVRWLGVRSRDLVPGGATRGPNDEDRKGLLRLSARDRKKAVGILGKDICEEDGMEQEWRRELQVMLMLNTKVEMEILSEREGGVKGWIEENLSEEFNRSGRRGGKAEEGRQVIKDEV